MTIRYVGPGGNDGNSGLTWALRKLTLNGIEDTPVVVGDIVYAGPGVYRETLTVDVSGGSAYNVGTVTVTNGSITVVGAGTAFLANVVVGDRFHIRRFGTEVFGLTCNGTATATDAGYGNFQAGHTGKIISISGRGAYGISVVVDVNTLTLSDPNGLGWPAAGVLDWDIISGQSHYEIVSVDDNTTLTLNRPWEGPTLAGMEYIAFTPITYIGDVTGENTDNIGGIVRITGSDNDQAAVRDYGIIANDKDYRIFRGFRLDTVGRHQILGFNGGGEHWIVEDCVFSDGGAGGSGIQVNGATQLAWTIRRCVFLNNYNSVLFTNGVALDDVIGHVVENCMHTSGFNIYSVRLGDFTVKNNSILAGRWGIYSPNALWTGRTIIVNNCIFDNMRYGIQAAGLGEITEDYNSFYLMHTATRINTAIGANSNTFPALVSLPLLLDGFKFPWWFGELSEWSQVAAIVGHQETYRDLRGLLRPTTSAKKSWGITQHVDAERDTGTVYAGIASYEFLDAGRIQFKVPCTNRSTMVRVRVQREANYAGTNPQMVIKQPGQADQTTVDVGAAGAWNLLEDAFIPTSDPEYFIVELVSNNTAVAGNYATYFDDLEIRGEPQNPGEFEHWMWDRQPFETLPSNALVVRGREYRRRRMPGLVSAMEEQ